MKVGLAYRPEWKEIFESKSFISPKFIEISIDSSMPVPSIQEQLLHTRLFSDIYIHVTQPCLGDDPEFFMLEFAKVEQGLSGYSPSVFSFHFAVERLTNGAHLPGMMPILSPNFALNAAQNLKHVKSKFPGVTVAAENIATNWMSAANAESYLSMLEQVLVDTDARLVFDVSNLEIMTRSANIDFKLNFQKLNCLPKAYAHIGGITKVEEFHVDFHGGDYFGDHSNLLNDLDCPIILEIDQHLSSPDVANSHLIHVQNIIKE